MASDAAGTLPNFGSNESVNGPAARDSIWSATGGAQFLWRNWDHDEILVYNVGSCETHLLDAFSAAALREIANQPRTLRALCRALVDQFDLDETAVAKQLVAVCDTFQRLGLAEPTDP